MKLQFKLTLKKNTEIINGTSVDLTGDNNTMYACPFSAEKVLPYPELISAHMRDFMPGYNPPGEKQVIRK